MADEKVLQPDALAGLEAAGKHDGEVSIPLGHEDDKKKARPERTASLKDYLVNAPLYKLVA
jgi:hypothetical protein